MKLKMGLPVFLPILALLLVAMVACSRESEGPAEPRTLEPTPVLVEEARPLTPTELAAIEDFDAKQQDISERWEEFYQDFDDWRAGLTSCHPNTARETLREFAATFASITDTARNLPRASATREMADLLISASLAEEAAFRQLRDRWQPGNISLLEAVEQKRTESGRTQNSVADMSLQQQEEFEEGPTASEVEEMEEFSDTFDEIWDDWDDFHDDYSAFAKREHRLNDEDLAEGYAELVEQFRKVLASIQALTPTEITEELIETLLDAAEEELDALEYFVESLSEKAEPETAAAPTPAPAPAPTPAAPAPTPVPTEPAEAASTPEDEPKGEAQQEMPVPVPEPTRPPEMMVQPTPQQTNPKTGPESGPKTEPEEELPSPREELEAAIEDSEAALEDIENSIEEIADDKSAEYLEDLMGFDIEYQAFVEEWNSFHEDFIRWRATDGECDRVGVARELALFTQRSGELARMVRDLPQHGFLLPVYTLTVEAAEREAGAIRTMASSWTPFAIDVFKPVDEERVNAGRLRRQAGIALAELRARQ